jgi:serine/threonine protein kinase
MRDRVPKHIAAKAHRIIRLGGRTYYLLEQLSSNVTEHGARYRAFVPSARPDGGYRAVHILDKSRTTRERLRRLQHLDDHSGVTNLPRIDEYHEKGHQIYVVLPWVKGHTLREHLDGARRVDNNGHKGISLSEAIKLFVAFAHALAHLHRHLNVIHGDLKPENLIVHPRPNRLVMIDFGSAWLVQQTMRRGERDGVSPNRSRRRFLPVTMKC